MNKPLHDFFTQDHRRIDELLDEATKTEKTNLDFYQRFRTGLLRHIRMEEIILFPAAKLANKGMMPEMIPKFRLEHGALTALMVIPPTPVLIKVIKYILDKHDYAEEKQGGLYEICESLAQDQTKELLSRLQNTAEVLTNPLNPAGYALEAAKRSLLRANFNFDEIAEIPLDK